MTASTYKALANLYTEQSCAYIPSAGNSIKTTRGGGDPVIIDCDFTGDHVMMRVNASIPKPSLDASPISSLPTELIFNVSATSNP